MTNKTPPKPFATDGCSGGMSWFYAKLTGGKKLPWHGCCVEHDKAYWQGGGTGADRLLADAKLAKCVADNGYPIWGRLMFWGVHFGGHPWLPTPWRWGYGWPYFNRGGGYERKN